MKIDGACHCGYIRVEDDADPGEDYGLPLHGLPSRQWLRLPRQCSRSGCDLSHNGPAGDIPQNHGRVACNSSRWRRIIGCPRFIPSARMSKSAA